MKKPIESVELYNNQILLLAGNIPLMERIPFPDATVTKRSNLCGSKISVDLKMDNQVITNYSHEVSACALGQASATILANEIIGKSGDEIVQVRKAVVKMLNGSNYDQNIFRDYQFLKPASQFKNRHDSILLVLNAAVEAIIKIRTLKESCSKQNLGSQINK